MAVPSRNDGKRRCAQAVSSSLQAILASSNPDETKGSQYNLRQLSDELSAGLGDQVAGYHIQLAEILTNQSRTVFGPEDARRLSMDAAARTKEARRHIRQAIEAYDRMAIEFPDNLDRRLEAIAGFVQVLTVCLAAPGFAAKSTNSMAAWRRICRSSSLPFPIPTIANCKRRIGTSTGHMPWGGTPLIDR